MHGTERVRNRCARARYEIVAAPFGVGDWIGPPSSEHGRVVQAQTQGVDTTAVVTFLLGLSELSPSRYSIEICPGSCPAVRQRVTIDRG
jgi:hypothetical protein